MTKIEIIVPPLYYNNVLEFAFELNNIPPADEYIFDFKEMDYVKPFGMLFMGALLRQFKEKNSKENGSILRASNFNKREAHSYAAQMGLFRSFGLSFGKEPGEAQGNENYIPMTKIGVQALKENAQTEYKHVGEIIEIKSNKIAKLLTRQANGDLVDYLTYSIREIFRNVVEHSKADTIWFAGQYWPFKNNVEIAILDQGLGIRQTISRNPNLDIKNDLDAIRYSIEPGISGKNFKMKGKRNKHDGEWSNSGYGLYMTSNLCKIGGSFLLCSGDKALYVDSTDTISINTVLQGTAIRLQLNTISIKSLKMTLSKILKEAGAVGRTASKMSTMLSKNNSKLK